MIRIIWVLLVSVGLGGCFTFKDLGTKESEDGGTGTETEGTAPSSTESTVETDGPNDTGTGNEPPTDVETETDTDTFRDTASDTVTDTGDDLDGGEDTDSHTAGGDTDSDTSGDAGDTDTTTADAPPDGGPDASSEDTDSSSADSETASPDTDTHSDSAPDDTETSTGTGPGRDTETDTCAVPETCDSLDIECGDFITSCGVTLPCGGCPAGQGLTCENNQCVPCLTPEHCGNACELCGDPTMPACVGDTPAEAVCACVEPTEVDGGIIDDSCGGETARCVDGTCEACIDNDACGEGCNNCGDDLTTPICVGDTPETARCECEIDSEGVDSCGDYAHCVGGECVACDQNDACGADCMDCTATGTPYCDLNRSNGTCVECLETADCRDDGSSVDALNTLTGVCTPDNTCTCWTDWVTDTNASTCLEAADCPSDGDGNPDNDFVCAQDIDGLAHYACLRLCDSNEPVPSENGLTCEPRLSSAGSQVLVWTPVTSCFAYYKFNEPCSDHDECRVSSDDAEGACQTFNAVKRCTYSCWDGEALDALCPEGHTCSTSPPVGVCVP